MLGKCFESSTMNDYCSKFKHKDLGLIIYRKAALPYLQARCVSNLAIVLGLADGHATIQWYIIAGACAARTCLF